MPCLGVAAQPIFQRGCASASLPTRGCFRLRAAAQCGAALASLSGGAQYSANECAGLADRRLPLSPAPSACGTALACAGLPCVLQAPVARSFWHSFIFWRVGHRVGCAWPSGNCFCSMSSHEARTRRWRRPAFGVLWGLRPESREQLSLCDSISGHPPALQYHICNDTSEHRSRCQFGFSPNSSQWCRVPHGKLAAGMQSGG